jgi:hypothetical protein
MMLGLILSFFNSRLKMFKPLDQSIRLLLKLYRLLRKKDSGGDISIFGSIMLYFNNKSHKIFKKPKKYTNEQ